jgi:uncharacterized protein involved in exopolysaccharide biosynthesis
LEPELIPQNDEYDLIGFVLSLAARWKLLLCATLIGAIVGAVFSIVSPKTYQSTATIYVQGSSSLASQLNDLPISLGAGSGSSSDYLQVLLQSDTFAQFVVSKLHLQSNPNFAGNRRIDIQDAIRQFRSCVSVQTGKTGATSIDVKAHNPRLAADIANAMLDHLGEVAVTQSDRKKEYTSRKLDETSRDLDAAEDRMRKFLEKNGIASIDDQTKSMVQALSDLESKLVSLDTDIESLRSQLANAGDLDTLVDSEVQLKTLESSRKYLASKRDELHKQIERLPNVGARYARLQRDIESLSKTYEILTEQYQLASITRQGEDGDYQIIDRARPNLKKVGPHTMINTAMCGMLALIIAIIAINLQTAISERKRQRKMPLSSAPKTKITERV